MSGGASEAAPPRAAVGAPQPPQAPPGPPLADDAFLKIRLNLGRAHGQKAATIRSILKDRLGLEGRAIRDLTVRDASTLFRAPESDFDRIHGTLEGIEIAGVTITVTRPDASKSELRVPPPADHETDEGDEAAAEVDEASEAAELPEAADAPLAAEDAPPADDASATPDAGEAPVAAGEGAAASDVSVAPEALASEAAEHHSAEADPAP